MERPGEIEALKRALAPEALPEALRARLLAPPRRLPAWPWIAVAAAALLALGIQTWRIERSTAPVRQNPTALEPDIEDSRNIVLEVLKDETSGLDALLAGLLADRHDQVRVVFHEALARMSGSLKDKLGSPAPSADLLASLDESFQRAGLDIDAPLRESRRSAALAWGRALAEALGIDEAAVRELAAAAEARNDVLVLPGLIGEDGYAVLTGLHARIEPFVHDDRKAAFRDYINSARARLAEGAATM